MRTSDLVLRDHDALTERVVFSFEMYEGQNPGETLEDLTSNIPHDIPAGQEYACYVGDTVYATWDGEDWTLGDTHDPAIQQGGATWTRIVGKPVVQWYGGSGGTTIFRHIRNAILRAMVVGMGLEVTEHTSSITGVLLYSIEVPEPRVQEFYDKVKQLGEDFRITNLGTVDCPSQELADMLRQRYGLDVNRTVSIEIGDRVRVTPNVGPAFVGEVLDKFWEWDDSTKPSRIIDLGYLVRLPDGRQETYQRRDHYLWVVEKGPKEEN